MTDRFPLVLKNTPTNVNEIGELPAGDNLNLAENNIINVQHIEAMGNISASNFLVNGSPISKKTFLELEDTPSTFDFMRNKFVTVNEQENGLEFKTIVSLTLSDISVDNFIGSNVRLQPGGQPVNPLPGTIVVADGTTWDPTGTGLQALLVYLNGVWVQIA